ncbi:hypothetical protein JW835_05930 [bacterium]|nr:hypothetical protein [bacterium]
MIKILVYNLLFLLLVPFHSLKARPHRFIFNRPSLEIGSGHNTLFWSSPVSIKTPGGVPVNRTKFYFTSNIRLNYHLNLFGNTHALPFIGYNRFGGNSGEDKYYFDTIEIGSLFIYRILNVRLGAGAKINSQFKAIYQSSSFDMEENRSDWFTKWSSDMGLRAGYYFKPVYISIECWFGLSNLANRPLPNTRIRQNHYRILIGYTI